jgi:uncharacterized OB-fold protein
MTAGSGPPRPRLTGLTGEYYGWLRGHELRFQRCSDCGRFRHVPRELCATCGSDAFEWAASSGRGRVFSWTTTYRAMHPRFLEVPFTTVVVELEEGPRVLSSVEGVDEDDLRIGMPVHAVFDDVDDELTLLRFVPA